jgi:beta-xylosidase
MGRLTLREKVAQLQSLWLGVDASGQVAPHQGDFSTTAPGWREAIKNGLGQLTRPYGTAPVDALEGAARLADLQRSVVGANRFGIPALVHEECLTGLTTWQAAVYPGPLCWGASFDPGLVEEIGAQIGRTMQALGVHQGLAPVLDVVRDLRWGRVEETIGEDPYLVGTIGSAYVRGLQSAGVVATLKHFVGYSSSRAGRNFAPVSMGGRELADVMLPPFEMALRDGARSVMNAYNDVDGVPVAADKGLLSDLLRGTYGFRGTVVSDYFAIAFLHSLHRVAVDLSAAAAIALEAGIDVELPNLNAYGEGLVGLVETGAVDEALVDRSARRVLMQKCELGLLDPDWSPDPPALGQAQVPLDGPEHRGLARKLAHRSLVLLANNGALPLSPGARVALVGPLAADPTAMLGCYSFPMHVGPRFPELPVGIEIPTVLDALRRDPAGYSVSFAAGGTVLRREPAEVAAAAGAAAAADVCVAVLGDRAGLFGAGTSGEGCDAADLRLPGGQEGLLEAVLATGTPTVLVLLVGRPYDISRQVSRLAGALCGFFLGEEGATAVADVLSGRVNPSGHLPVSFPPPGGTQPSTYLAAPLGRKSEVSNIDPTPLFAFGHGLAYAAATWGGVEPRSGPEWPTDGAASLAVTLRNDTPVATAEVVQVYLQDPVAEVARPERRLIAAHRVELGPGTAWTVVFALHADLTSYVGRAGDRCVDPGEVTLLVGASSTDIRATLAYAMTGERRAVGYERAHQPVVEVHPAGSPSGAQGRAPAPIGAAD